MIHGFSPARLARLAVWSAASGAAIVLYFVAPEASRWIPPCPVRAVTGFDCSGCGSLRALHRLLHGDLAGAIRMNVLAVASLPLIGWLLLADLRGKPAPVRPWALWTYFAVVLVYGVVRNLPWEPVRVLAPH